MSTPPPGVTRAAMRSLFPPSRAEVDDSAERLVEVRDILEHSGLDPAWADNPLKWSNYPPESPTPKQHAALLCTGEEPLLWGGAAGGGKSSWGLQGALQYADVPGYAALILRRSYAELNKSGALIDRAREWLADTDAVWRGRDNKFVFPSGAQMEFGFIARDADLFTFQSAQYQYIFFDELTAFTEYQFRYMMSRLRRLIGSTVPIRMRAASNPGGKPWVGQCFPVGGGGPTEEGWAFIPALLEDNPYLDKEAYERSLDQLDPYTRAQLRHGDWNVRPPGNWAYDRWHLDAAVSIGRRMDRERERDARFEPAGDKQYIGVDFGELSAVVIAWPMAGGGWYVVDEHIWGDEDNKSEPDVEAHTVLRKLDVLGPFHLDRMRYDAARPESQRLMARTFTSERGAGYGRPSPISFAKYKRAAVRHLRALTFRAWVSESAVGEESTVEPYAGLIGISPNCSKLIECLYAMEREIEDPDALVKKKDDPNDALLALIAPDARKKSKLTDAPEPDEVKKRLQRVAEAAESARAALFRLGSG